jgi:hypothetical protein
MGKLILLTMTAILFGMSCTKQPDVARPTEHNLKRQEEVRQRDVIPNDNVDYRESRDLPDGPQVYEEDIEIDER